ncbi:homoserine dehydrogenase [Umboniibacter marinipuniceus]|uniref:Homoserine dehydrogenase n=1 Tax=Umboniibacter marinipuniceus TaxID=569599 RepID=A0A3M0A3E7_9GAMM|nr:homoserine dehydrogenase [Umboniibacter marinipuniceus]RMA79350.1 homoserine dehydrogenase [Umboniibacter marinipuniceus]
MKVVKLGLCGLGTVGSGVVNIFERNADLIRRRTGKRVVINHIGARSDSTQCDVANIKLSRDIFAVANDDDVDILIELIGGTTVAKDLVEAALKNGKHVVTANKALIAEHGDHLFKLAEECEVVLRYEAAVAGGIPIIKTLTEGLSANEIHSIVGIINGTGNFILSAMTNEGKTFESALAEAQRLGYAEADPTFDVEGIDAAHKLQILASLGFDKPFEFGSVSTEGISKITPADIEYAKELGYRIKHLGIARRRHHGFELRVHPALVPVKHSLANVDDALNAVFLYGDAVGGVLSVGAGAGSEPTASAVIADVVDIVKAGEAARVIRPKQTKGKVLPLEDAESSYYIRFKAIDKAGVMAAITSAFSNHGISLEAISQKEKQSAEDDQVTVVLLTHGVREWLFNQALIDLKALDGVVGDIAMIRVETRF